MALCSRRHSATLMPRERAWQKARELGVVRWWNASCAGRQQGSSGACAPNRACEHRHSRPSAQAYASPSLCISAPTVCSLATPSKASQRTSMPTGFSSGGPTCTSANNTNSTPAQPVSQCPSCYLARGATVFTSHLIYPSQSVQSYS